MPALSALLIDAEARRREDELVAARRHALHPGDVDRALLEVAGALGRRHQHHGRAVAHDAAVEEPERVHHHAGRLVVGDAHGLLHHGQRVEARVGAERHRHRGKLGAGRAIERHVTLHGERGAARRRGEAVVRRFRVGAAGLAVALEVVRPAQDVALAGEAQHVHAGDDVRHAGCDRHRRGLQAAGDEAAVGPGLVDEIDLEAEGLGHLVVVDAERPADMDGEAVDVAPLEACVLERRFERLGGERKLALEQVAAEGAGANADDRRLVAQGLRHYAGSVSKNSTRRAFWSLPVVVSGREPALTKRYSRGTL